MEVRQKNKQYWWKDRAWRTIHFNFREIDMMDLKPENIMATLKEFNVNTVILNTAGIIANYETKLPYHYKNPYMKNDALKQIFDACRRENIRIISRIDFSKIRRPIYEMHPEWAYRNINGEINDYYGNIHVCFNSEYQQKLMLEVLREVMVVLNPDGFFLNMGEYAVGYDYSRGWQGICQCDTCKRKFYEMFGEILPVKEDDDDPVYQDYKLFQKKTITDYYQNIQDLIHSIRPDVLFYHMTNTEMLRVEISTSVSNPKRNFLYQGAELLKVEKGSYPEKVCGEVSVDAIDMCYRFVSVSKHELALRMAQSLANGGFVDFYMNGRPDNHPNRTGFETLKRFYHYHKMHEADYYARESVSEILLIKPKLESFQKEKENMQEYRGFYNVLTQNHYLIDCAESDTLANVDYLKYKIILLPDIFDLSDKDCARLDMFVENGGILVASGETAQYDERHNSRGGSGLYSLGIKCIDQVNRDCISAYLHIDNKALFPDFLQADYIYIKGMYCMAKYETGVEKHQRLIPPHRFAPPEQAYTHEITDHPGFTIYSYGKGKGVYIPWMPGKEYDDFGFINQGDFIHDLLQYVLKIQPIKGNLPPMVEISHTVRRETGVHYIHLVNDSGGFMKSYFAPLPIENLYVDIPWRNTKVNGVYSLVHERHLDYEEAEGYLRIQIPRLELFDAIRIE